MAVIHADGIKFKRHAAGLAYGLLGDLAKCVQVDVPRNQIDVAVTNPDEGLVEVAVATDGARSLEQAAVRGALEPAFDGVASHRVGRLQSFRGLGQPHDAFTQFQVRNGMGSTGRLAYNKQANKKNE